MAINWVLPVRIVQLVFAIIVLGLTGYAVNKINSYTFFIYHDSSPSQLNFLLFCAVWSLLAAPFLLLAPIYDSDGHHIGHKFVVFAVDTVTAIFWFAGFIALAALIGTPNCGSDTLCGTLQASVAFGAFEWVLFTVTSVFNGLWAFKDSYSHDPKPSHEGQVSEGV